MGDTRKKGRMDLARLIHRYLIWQHRWIGLLMTGFLIVVGLTGSLLAYRTEVDRILNPNFYANVQPGSKRLTLGEIAARAEQQEPRIQAWYLYDQTSDSVSVRCVPRKDPQTGKPYAIDFDHMILNPYTGQELGHRSEYQINSVNRQNFTAFLYQLHTSLAAGDKGWAFLGYVALVWTLDCLVGFYLTLPLGFARFLERWKYSWWVKWRASGFRVHFDLHRANGLWLWPLLFIFAWSGVMFNFSPVYSLVTCAVANCYDPGMDFVTSFKGHVTERPKLDWRAAEERGRQLMAQQAELRGFKVVRPAGLALIGNVGIYSYIAQTTLDVRRDTPDTAVFLDADTGEFRQFMMPRPSSGVFIGAFLRGAHFGDLFGSFLYRLLVFIVGVAVAILAYTGVYIWWRKRSVRKMSVIRRTTAAPA